MKHSFGEFLVELEDQKRDYIDAKITIGFNEYSMSMDWEDIGEDTIPMLFVYESTSFSNDTTGKQQSFDNFDSEDQDVVSQLAEWALDKTDKWLKFSPKAFRRQNIGFGCELGDEKAEADLRKRFAYAMSRQGWNIKPAKTNHNTPIVVINQQKTWKDDL